MRWAADGKVTEAVENLREVYGSTAVADDGAGGSAREARRVRRYRDAAHAARLLATKHAEQVRVFRTIPGLENADFARLGGLHRNTFLNSPKLLDQQLRLRPQPRLRFAGQPGEQWTMFFRDPSGNPIEVKGFESLDEIYDT